MTWSSSCKIHTFRSLNTWTRNSRRIWLSILLIRWIQGFISRRRRILRGKIRYLFWEGLSGMGYFSIVWRWDAELTTGLLTSITRRKSRFLTKPLTFHQKPHSINIPMCQSSYLTSHTTQRASKDSNSSRPFSTSSNFPKLQNPTNTTNGSNHCHNPANSS